ncbi:alpha/beta hydrolase [Ruegeria pomeroyi]|uniref:Esterase, putative n=2 Tax=Ruegeria pomeroyi TaxID=89184 RepID=Q5LSN7_RUEPO|nr:alpha/beta hydrolase [Ruegeria pomeroyi]AAV95010.1 esterase, putative [Ruegeria pomeroyi DSS-3]NVK99265.1 alpha/beta hydrolase [Ruegeria pomeroyi]NVL02301.1 alpha/beta hydrolase [Ruegeria pomeroyi]QWV08590.1 alpha/beta hydrolase [Ruegeria pomeroyi]
MRVVLILALLAAGFWALTLWRAARHEARAQASHPPLGQFVTVEGLRIHAEVMGSGPDLVMIHGSNGNTRDLSFVLAPILADHFRVILLDRPGLGFSDPAPAGAADIAGQARLLMLAAEQLGAKRPIVLGHSYGGSVALAWAVHHPDRLAALVPVAAPSNPWNTPLDLLYRVTSTRLGAAVAVPLITAYVPDSYVTRALEDVFAPQPAPAGYADHFGPGLSLRRASLRANAAHRASLLGEIEALHPRYGEIAVPTEIVHGTEDDTVNFDLHSTTLSGQISGAVLTPLPGVGHMPQHVAAQVVADAVLRAATRAGLR